MSMSASIIPSANFDKMLSDNCKRETNKTGSLPGAQASEGCDLVDFRSLN